MEAGDAYDRRPGLPDRHRPRAGARRDDGHGFARTGTADRFNMLAYYNGRKQTDNSRCLPDVNLALDESAVSVEGQTNWSFANGRASDCRRLGWRHGYQQSRSERRIARHCFSSLVDSRSEAVFGQVKWNVTERLNVVLGRARRLQLASRQQFSPKAAIAVRCFDRDQSVRFTYNRAFQVPSLTEFFRAGRCCSADRPRGPRTRSVPPLV